MRRPAGRTLPEQKIIPGHHAVFICISWQCAVRDFLDRHIPQPGAPDRRDVEWGILDSLIREPPVTILGKHQGAANQVAVFPDGRRAASVGDDNRLRLWDLTAGESLGSFDPGPTSVEPLFSVAISPDGSTLATGSDMVLLWDADRGEPKKPLPAFEANVQSLAFSPEGKYLAAGARYDRVRIVTPEGTLVREILDGSRHESLAFAADGRRLLVPIRKPVPGSEAPEGLIRAYDVPSFAVSADYSVPGTPSYKNYTLVACAPDNSFYAMCEPGAVMPMRLVDPESGQVLLELSQSRAHINAVAIGPDSRRVAAAYGDGSIGYWKLLRNDRGQLELAARQNILPMHQGEANSLHFANKKRMVSCGADGLVKTCDLSAMGDPLVVNTRSAHLASIAMDQHDRMLAATQDTVLTARPTGEIVARVRSPQGFRNVAFSPGHDRFAGCLTHGNGVEIRRLDSGELLARIPIVNGADFTCFSPDGQVLAVLDRVGTLSFWNIATRAMLSQLSIHGSVDGPLYRCRYSPDGNYALYASESQGVVVVNAREYKIERRLTTSSATEQIVFSPAGDLLATAHSDGRIRLWKWPQCELLGQLSGHEGPVADIAFANDRRLFSTSGDGTTRIWSIPRQRSLGVLDRRPWQGRALAVSPDGKVVCIGYEDLENHTSMLVIVR